MKILFLNRELDLDLGVVDFMSEFLFHFQQVQVCTYTLIALCCKN